MRAYDIFISKDQHSTTRFIVLPEDVDEDGYQPIMLLGGLSRNGMKPENIEECRLLGNLNDWLRNAEQST